MVRESVSAKYRNDTRIKGEELDARIGHGNLGIKGFHVEYEFERMLSKGVKYVWDVWAKRTREFVV